MGFSFKRIEYGDVSLNKKIYNKEYNIENFNDNIKIYIGENNPINKLSPFNYINDSQTTNNEYKRLIYNSIKNLYYKDFTPEGELLSSSSYEFYPETTLHSGSYNVPYLIRRLPHITGSPSISLVGSYNNMTSYDDNYLYDDSLSYDNSFNNKVLVLSINKNIYSNRISPNTFIINNENVYIRDDNEGNLFNFLNYSNYIEYLSNKENTYEFIGNIFYSMGIIIITNMNYLCIFNSPPTTVNDYISYHNLNQPESFDITMNDYTDCSGIDYSSIELNNISGYTFPDCYVDNGFLYIINNQNSYIPGTYKIGYTINNINGLQSNTSSINLTITSDPLSITNIDNDKICNNTSSILPFTFTINGGVPEYSWSIDGINYNYISGFQSPLIITSSSSPFNKIYIKDYLENIVEENINFYYPNINYNIIINNPSICSNILSGTINIESNQAISYSLDSNPTMYNISESILISTGSHIIKLYDIYGCTTSSLINITPLPLFNYNISTTQPTCFDNGYINIDYLGTEPYSSIITIQHPTSGTLIYQTSSLTINNISDGEIYNIKIEDTTCEISESITINNNNEIIFSVTGSYENPCYSIVNFNTSGGLTPFTYNIITPSNIYNSDSSSIVLYNDYLNNIFITASITDNNGCTSSPQYLEIYGRTYIYSGSYCEQI